MLLNAIRIGLRTSRDARFCQTDIVNLTKNVQLGPTKTVCLIEVSVKRVDCISVARRAPSLKKGVQMGYDENDIGEILSLKIVPLKGAA